MTKCEMNVGERARRKEEREKRERGEREELAVRMI